MPIVFASTPRLRLRTATYFGVIDDMTLLRAYRNASAGGDSSFDSAIDLSGITSVRLTGAAEAELAPMFSTAGRGSASARLVLIAPGAHISELAELLQQLHAGMPIHLCASLEDALLWLGHAPGPA